MWTILNAGSNSHGWLIAVGGHLLAGFCDAIAGGGGIIGLPALLLAGLPPHLALGTNKLSSTIGTALTTLRLMRVVRVRRSTLIVAIPIAMVASTAGAMWVAIWTPKMVKMAMTLVLPIMLILLVWHQIRTESPPVGQSHPAMLSGVSMGSGLYDGILGPGVGTMLLMGFHRVLGQSWLLASAHAKCVNLSTNMMALVVFFANGVVSVKWGIMCSVANGVGGWVGIRLVLRYGDQFIKKLIPIMLSAAIATLLYHLGWG